MRRIAALIMGIFCTVVISIAAVFAWFTNGELIEPDNTGSSVSAYFGGGDGSEGKPFLIKNSRHLYNLAWLQYIGRFNRPGLKNVPNEKNTSSLTQYCFKLEKSINMDEYEGVYKYLPPIGTEEYPFIGKLDGAGYTISNLISTNDFASFGTKHPNIVVASDPGDDQKVFETNIIGFIGVIGETSSMKKPEDENFDFESMTIASGIEPSLTTIGLQATQVDTKQNTNVLVGVVAGYVNGTISDVGVVNGKLNVASQCGLYSNYENLSGYTVVGFAEDEYTTKAYKNDTVVYNPTSSYISYTNRGINGSDNDWGGSMNMDDMYHRILKIIPRSGATVSSYRNSEIKYNFTHSDIYTTASSSSHVAVNYNNSNGSYIKTNPNNGDTYNYLTSLYKTVIKVTKTNDTADGYKISNKDNYLNIVSSRVNNTLDFEVVLSNGNSSPSATTWVLGENKLYTYNEDDGFKYYLLANSDLSLSVTNDVSNASTWIWNTSKGSYATTIESNEYFLNYFSGEWSIKPLYIISDGNGNFLKYDSSISNVSNMDEATIWRFSNNGTYPSGTIRNESGLYLRNNNGTLNVSNNNSNNIWYNNYNQIYNTYNNNSYYLQFTSNTWQLITPTTFYIQYNGNYLYLNNSGTIQTSGTTNINIASAFNFTNTLKNVGGNGKIYFITGNNSYYLQYNNGTFNTTTTANNGSTFYNDGNGLYVIYNNTNYYLQYKNNTWQMAIPTTTGGYYISYNNYYLNATDTTTISGSTTPSTVWYVDGNNRVYTVISGTNYYLGATSSDVAQLYDTASSARYPVSGTVNGSVYETSYTGWRLNYNNGYWQFSNGNYTVDWQQIVDFENTPTGTYFASNVVPLSFDLSNEALNLVSNTINVMTREQKNEASVFNYIPLNASSTSPYNVDDKNTGYIMSGAYSGSNYSGLDIRVSQYTMAAINQNGNVTLSNSKFQSFGTNKIRSVNGVDSNNIYYINDSNNDFVKYSESKNSLVDILSGNSNLYGLHFMSADININHLVTAPEVTINKKTYTNYQMPEDCIDFNVASKGYINFFAGTYYPGNNSFFSLHQIIRDETDANGDGIADNPVITAIKHISKIYKANSTYGLDYKSADYVYQYEDGTYSINDFVLSKYDLVFKKEWIEEPGSYSNIGNNGSSYVGDVFYFEIPVNKGEFALGSVSGRTGAYLFYLDIGANAQTINRTSITQKSELTTSTLEYVNGIQILATMPDKITPRSIIASESAVAKISSVDSNGDSYTISRTNDAITITGGSTALTSTYFAPNVTLNYVLDNSSTGSISMADVPKTTKTYSQILLIDFNISIDDVYFTTITDDGTNRTITKSGKNADGTDMNQTELDSWGLYKVTQNGNNVVVDVINPTTQLNNFPIDIPNNVSSICEYNYRYTATATPSYQIVIEPRKYNSNIDSATYEDYYQFDYDDITVGLTGSTETVTITVTVKDDDYVIYINNTAHDNPVSLNSTIQVTGTAS